MKKIGFILIAIGLALITFIVFSLFEEENRFHSPIPQDKGVKVIFLTPTN